MAELSKEDILEAVANMSVMDVCDLVSAMEEKFGVSATAVAVAGPAATGAAEASAAEEKTEFNVVMTEVGSNRINVIKAINSITGSGLKASKDMVEKTPVTIKENAPKEDAEAVKKQLEEAGAKVELK